MPLRILAALLALALPLAAQERPWSVSPCELLKNPGMYGDTLVSVSGLVLYGSGQFTIHGFDCADDYGALALEFGGNPTDPKDQFRLPEARLEAGTVPLNKDVNYATMQRLMKEADASGKIKMLRATFTGRFFAGPAVGTKSGEIKHPNARLVISDVEQVSNRLETPVDFSPASHATAKPVKGCTTTELTVPSRDEEDKLQRLSREPSENLDYLADPKKVAARAVAGQEQLPPDAIEAQLRSAAKDAALNSYLWTSADGLRTYAITVDRPYWLLPSTYSGDTVIWVPNHIVRTVCTGKPSR